MSKIGQLCAKQITVTRTGGRLPLSPEANALGAPYFWSWQTHLATGVELHVDFGQSVILSQISLELGPDSALSGAEVFSDGLCVGEYHSESGHSFGGTVAIELCHKARHFVLRLFPTLTDLALNIPLFWGAVPTEHTLFPTPTKVEWRSGCLPVSTACAVCSDAHADSEFACAYLAESAKERWGLEVTDGTGLSVSVCDSLPTDGYVLDITPDQANLSASNRLGLLYGIERLFELAKEENIPCCRIEDSPYKELRGIHMLLPNRANLAFTKRLWQTVLLPFHYNTVFLEIAGGMRYESHPEISEGWLRAKRLSTEGKIPPMPHGDVAEGELLEKDEVRDLCNFARNLGLELIPEVQSLGHVQYITYAHPDIAEIDPNAKRDSTDARVADIPPSLFYHHSYCPQNKKSYEIIFDLMDEIIEVTAPKRFVHMGHDEVYQLGLCPRCQRIPEDVLFEQDILALHGHLKEKGLRMMIWSDMLQPVSKYKSWPAAERLPRDIVMLDFIWYFHLDKDIEENILKHGYEVAIGNLYSSHFPRYESRIEPLIGGEISFWCVSNERAIAAEGKFYDMMYTAEMLWSKEYRHEAHRIYAELIAERLPRIRAALRNTPILSLADKVALPLPQHFCEGVCGVPLQQTTTLDVNTAAEGLRFVHTTLYREKRIAWKELVRIGTYTVEFEDGVTEQIAVEYDGNVRCFGYGFGEPLSEKYYRHEGYVCAWAADPVVLGRTPNGTPITAYALDWQNPTPEKRIRRVICHEAADSAAGLLLCGLYTLKST